VNFFCSVEHVEDWLFLTFRAGRTLTVEKAAQAGRRLWRAMPDAA
jgi:hypothetical protein